MAKLLSSLPVGALVKDTTSKFYGQPVVWKVMQHGHSGDPSGSTALVTEKIISVRCFDAKEPNNSDSNRRSYGNNRYLYSNLLQWLNSDAAAGAWYTAKHSQDQAPSSSTYTSNNPYSAQVGFLNGFSTNMKAALMTVTKRTAKNTVTDGGSYEDVSSKVFLLSNTEVGLSNENSVAEGNIYTLFSTSSNRIAYPTAQAVSNSDYTNSSFATGSPWYWWLRTPYASYSCYARYISTDGSLDDFNACYGNYGVRPACAVSSSILVSDAADTDGAYIIQWNAAPIITTPSTSLGDKNSPFNVTFSITDPDGDSVSATVKLDSSTVQTISTVNQGSTYTYSVTGTVLNGLSNGAHTITITATDSMSNSSTKTISFTKTTSPVTISGTDGSIGNLWMNPSYTYQIGDDATGVTVGVVEAIDGETTKTRTNITLGADIAADFETFEELSNEETHTLTITATDSNGALAIRTITFKKLGAEIEFYTDAVETDEAAKKIVVEANYSKEGNPTIKVEVTNDALATIPTWEDMTEEFENSIFHNFTNKPTEGFGVSARITLTKNETTERIYVYSMGFSFY